jgi:hypothetical protein
MLLPVSRLLCFTIIRLLRQSNIRLLCLSILSESRSYVQVLRNVKREIHRSVPICTASIPYRRRSCLATTYPARPRHRLDRVKASNDLEAVGQRTGNFWIAQEQKKSRVRYDRNLLVESLFFF